MEFKTVFDVIDFYVGKLGNPLNEKTFAEIAKEYNVSI